MAITADQVIVELEAKVADYNRKVADAERKFDRSMAGIQGSARRMERGVGLAFKGMAAAVGTIGLLNLGRQAVQTALDFKRVETAMATATGSTEAAGVQFEYLRGLAERLGLRFITLADTYTGFAAAARGTNIEGRQTQEIFEAITTAVVATGGSAEQTEGALRAIEQMISKGTVSAEELRGQLGERLPGAFQIAARAMGVTTAELGKMLEKGEVVADEFLPRFAEQLRSELPTAVETADAAFQRFQTVLDDIANSTADGFMRELGTATDDLTAILKEMQASGALEAFGAFLGDIIRLGGVAVQTLGNLILKIDELQRRGMAQGGILRDIEFTQASNQANHGLTEGVRARGRERLVRLLGPEISEVAKSFGAAIIGGGGAPVQRGAFGTGDFALAAVTQAWELANRRTRTDGGGGGSKKPSRTRQPREPRHDPENWWEWQTAAERREVAAFEEAMSTDFVPSFAGAEESLKLSTGYLDQMEQSLVALSEQMDGLDIGKMLTVEDQERLQRFADNFTRDLSDGLAASIVYGEDLGDALVDTFKRAAFEAISSGLMHILSGGAQGMSFGTFFSNIGSFLGFGGPRAAGGPVSNGKYYLVGENGPELFAPSQSGSIIPQARNIAAISGAALSPTSAATVVQRFQFDLRGAVMTQDLLAQMNQMAEAAAVMGAKGGHEAAKRDLRSLFKPRIAG